MDLSKNIAEIIEKYYVLENALLKEDISVAEIKTFSKEKSKLEEIVAEGRIYLTKIQHMNDLEEMLRDPECDLEMKLAIENEILEGKNALSAITMKIKILLLPVDEDDSKNAILEIRPGVGGDEAGLFAGEMLQMYRKFAERSGWKFELMSITYNDVGGLKEAVCMISGKSVFAKLKFESGTHRVQRVPDTESSGRIHTSTVTIAVLPEAEDVNVVIQDKDIRVEVFRASGPGGQCVNTTDSAVRMIHIPTGIVVSQQDEKSQIKNREKARKILAARVYEFEKRKSEEQMSQERRLQIGSGDRSEKIRTYNFPQDRITDHRIGITVHDIENIIKEGKIESVIHALIQEDEMCRMKYVEDSVS